MGDEHCGLSTMDSVAQDLLLQGGCALVSLSDGQQEVVARAFQCCRKALDQIQKHKDNNDDPSSIVRCILPSDDSAHATGYHSAGCMSRYNAHREGFVFSDGATFEFPMDARDDFEQSTIRMQECLHTIANNVIKELERNLDLPPNWFAATYQHEEGHSHQWHLKRYCAGDAVRDETSSTEDAVLLPSHTDPSLLSVVILDRAEHPQPGSMGLQVYGKRGDQQGRQWYELPLHGHSVATIFVGSVLSYVTGSVYPSAKHRVVQKRKSASERERMAATFFLRPKGSAILRVPPAPALRNVRLKKEATFDSWSARVSRNYMNKSTEKTARQDNHYQ